MATVTLEGWPAGATVTAYRESLPGQSLGTAVSSGDVADSTGRVSIDGLTERLSYTAEGGGRRSNFTVPDEAQRLRSRGVAEPEATELAEVTADGSSGELGVFHVEDYGAVPGTDSRAAILDAITAAAAAGGYVVGRPGAFYKLPNGLGLSGFSGVAGVRDLGLDVSAWTSPGTALALAGGALGAATTLNANATEGATTISAASWGSVAVGDWIKITSTKDFGATGQDSGEIGRVKTIVGTTLTLYAPLCDSYLTADGAQAEVVPFFANFSLENVHVDGPVSTAVSVTGISAARMRNLSARGIRCYRTHRQGLSLEDCIDSRVHDCHFFDNELTGFAYGITVNWACQDVVISGCTGTRMRHLVSIGGGSGGVRGIARNVVVADCHAAQITDAGFDCHAIGEGIHFRNCHVLSSDQDGFAFFGASGSVNGCSARNCARYGLLYRPSTSKPHDFEALDFRVRRSGQEGITIEPQTGFESWKRLQIRADIDTAAENAIDLNNTTPTRYENIDIEFSARNLTQHGCRLVKVGRFRVRARQVEITAASMYAVRIEDGQRGEILGGPITVTDGLSSTRVVGLFACDRVNIHDVDGDGSDFGIWLQTDCTNVRCHDCDLTGTPTPFTPNTGTGHRFNDNRPATTPTVASAATITLSGGENDVYKISGVATINTITAREAGARGTLIFTGTATVADSVGNVRLPANFVATADDVLELVCDGTNWFGAAPGSVN